MQMVLTHVSDVLTHSLALDQGGDPDAVVPVASAEEQLAIMRDHKLSRRDLYAGGKRSRKQTLRPAWSVKIRQQCSDRTVHV